MPGLSALLSGCERTGHAVTDAGPIVIHPRDRGRAIVRVGLVGAAVIATFVLLWRPWLSVDGVQRLLGRIFPVGRGLFEDKVANLWCSLSPIIKLKELYSIPFLTRMWYVSTVHARLRSSPSQLMHVRKKETRIHGRRVPCGAAMR